MENIQEQPMQVRSSGSKTKSVIKIVLLTILALAFIPANFIVTFYYTMIVTCGGELTGCSGASGLQFYAPMIIALIANIVAIVLNFKSNKSSTDKIIYIIAWILAVLTPATMITIAMIVAGK